MRKPSRPTAAPTVHGVLIALMTAVTVTVFALAPAQAQAPLQVFGWGANESGQLVIPPDLDPIAVYAGSHHSCALGRDGVVACWGCQDRERNWAQCQSDYSRERCTLRFCRSTNKPLRSMAIDLAQSCAVNAEGAIECWGCRPNRQLGQCSVPEGFRALDSRWPLPTRGIIAAGDYHSCAIAADRSVACWKCEKLNDRGQCSPPSELRASSVAANYRTSCAIALDGRVVCWGDDEMGQASPPPDLRAVEVAVGFHHACARSADGRVTCWGCGDPWVGRGPCTPPRNLRARQIVAGADATCAIDSQGRVVCWGCPAGKARGSVCAVPVPDLRARQIALTDGHVIALAAARPEGLILPTEAEPIAPEPMDPASVLARTVHRLGARAIAARAREEAQARAAFVHPLGIPFVDLPPGDFFMGSCGFRHATHEAAPCPSGAAPDDQADNNEFPQRRVRIDGPLQIAAFEITAGQFRAFLKATATEIPRWEEYNRAGDDHPAVWMDWHQARAFAEWLNVTRAPGDDGHYRLPTEAEWEYAARSGTTTRFWWGDHEPIAHMNCATDVCTDGWARTAPVGTFPPNPWGLYEILGNVDEWVEDCYVPGYVHAPTDGRARPVADCREVVARGGSFDYAPPFSRSAWRDFYEPHIPTLEQGFRLVRVPGGAAR